VIKSRAVRVSALLLLVMAAAAAREEPRWIRVRSANFELYTTAGEKKAREAVLYFEQVRAFFAKALNSKPATAGRVRIVAFNSLGAFKAYQPKQGSAAFATQDPDGDIIVMHSVDAADYPIAVHEYTHTLIRPLGEKVPLWLNEGLAELYSSLRAAGRKMTAGMPLPGRLAALREERWIPLEQLLAAGPDSPEYKDPKLAQAYYGECWALVHMLSLDEQYRNSFPAFTKKVLAGEPATEALRAVWGKDVMRVWKDLQRYASNSTWVYRIYDITLEKSAEEPEAAPAPPVDIAVLLATLRSHSHQEEAPEEFARLAAEFPDRPEVAEAAADFFLGQKRKEEAREQYARAVALGSRRAEVYRNYAALLGTAKEDHAKLVAALARAVELDPSDHDTRLNLAVGLVNDGRFAEAVAHLDKVEKVAPKDAFQLQHAYAYAYYRLGRKEEALGRIEKARTHAASPAEARMLDELERALKPPVVRAAGMVREHSESTAETDEGPAAEAVPRAPRKPETVAIEGILDRLDCLGTRARVRVRVAGQPIYLLIDDPRVGDTMLACGALKPRTVLVEYEPRPDRVATAAGTIYSIRYR
jgi:Flp pilus assembly protein TadD